MLYKSQLLTQASGSVGGVTAARNRGGMYFRGRAVPVNVNSPAQVSVRAALSVLTDAWANVLSEAGRAAWDLYAANVPLAGPLGDMRDVGGIGQYVRANVPRLRAGLARVDVAPTTYTEAEAPLATGFTAVAGAGVGNGFNLTLSNFPGAGNLLVQQGRPTSPGTTFFAGPFRFADDAAASPVSIPNTSLPWPVIAGVRQWARLRYTLDDGRLSPPVILTVLGT